MSSDGAELKKANSALSSDGTEEGWTSVKEYGSIEDVDDSATFVSQKSLKDSINVVHEDLSVKPVPADTRTTDEAKPDTTDVPFQKRVVQPIRAAFDQHFVPRVQNIQKTVDEQVKPHVARAVQNTHAAVQTHVASVHKTTQNTITTVSKQSQTVVHDRIVPALQKAQVDTTVKIHAVGSTARAAVDSHVHKGTVFHTRYASSYVGNAPAFSALYERAFASRGLPSLEDDSVPLLAFRLLEATLRSFGRVIFCNNPWTGLVILLALLLSHPWLAFAAIACSLTANVLALNLDLNKERVFAGHWSITATLVGAACVAYFDVTKWKAVVGACLVGAPMAVTLTLLFQRGLPPDAPLLHIPYNTVLLLLFLSSMSWNQVDIIRLVTQDKTDADSDTSLWIAVWKSTWCGISTVFLCPHKAWVGILIWIGVLFYSRIIAKGILLGSLVASLCAGLLIGVPPSSLSSGLVPYNAALTAAALVSHRKMETTVSVVPYIICFFAIVWTGAIQSAWAGIFALFTNLNMPLTIPFCAAAFPLLTVDFENYIGARARWPKRDSPIDVPPEDDADESEGGAEESSDADTANATPVGEVDAGDEEKHQDEVERMIEAEEEAPGEQTPLLV